MPYNCVHCSFEHLHPVTRCNMCERVQFDKEDVSNFVRGGATKRQLQLGSRSSSPRAPEQPVVVPIAPPGSKAPPPGSSALLSGDVKQAIEAKRLAALERQRNKGQEMGRPSVPLSGQAARPPSRVPPARPPPKNLYARPPPPKNLYARPPPICSRVPLLASASSSTSLGPMPELCSRTGEPMKPPQEITSRRAYATNCTAPSAW